MDQWESTAMQAHDRPAEKQPVAVDAEGTWPRSVEYFPTPGVTPFHDPRQHAVSLACVVPVEGACAPQQDARSS